MKQGNKINPINFDLNASLIVFYCRSVCVWCESSVFFSQENSWLFVHLLSLRFIKQRSRTRAPCQMFQCYTPTKSSTMAVKMLSCVLFTAWESALWGVFCWTLIRGDVCSRYRLQQGVRAASDLLIEMTWRSVTITHKHRVFHWSSAWCCLK